MSKKQKSDTHFDEGRTNSVTAPNITENQSEPMDMKKSLMTFLSLITVEPYVILYLSAILFVGLANRPLLMEKACRATLNLPKDVCLKVARSESDNVTISITEQASILSTDLSSWKDPVQIAIPALYVLFVGAWSDRTGNRRLILLIPLVGDMVTLVGLTFTVYYMAEWPLWVNGLIEVLGPVFSGGYVVALMGCYNYISDVTTPETRTMRLGIFTFSTNIVYLACKPIAGSVAETYGYYAAFGTAMICYAICFVYTYIRIRNLKTTDSEGTVWYKLGEFFHPRNLWEALSILVVSRGIRLVQIILIILVFMFVNGTATGEASISYQYVVNAFQMGLTELSIYESTSAFVSTIGTVIAVTVFVKWLKFHDSSVGLLTTISNVIASVIYGLAPNKQWFYVGALVDVFGNSAQPIIRSMATKIVEKENISKMLSFLSLVESVVPTIYTPLFYQIFNTCLKQKLHLGYVFIMGAILTVPAFVVFIALGLLYKRQKRNEVQQPEIKEMHAYDNEMVSHI